MVFPSSQREEYASNPLEEVICQLRFPPILKISTTSPSEFQDRIRKRYAFYEETRDAEIQLPKQVADLLAQVNLPPSLFSPSSTNIRHKFTTSDEKRSVILVQNFFALTESNYHSWNLLRDEIQFVEQSFRELYETEFYTRVGLRYRDRIIRSELAIDNVEWRELLNPELVGLLGDDSNAQFVRRTNNVVELAVPDISGASMNLRHGLIPLPDGSNGESCYVIDIDLYTTSRSSAEDAYDALDKFNAIAGNLFRWAIGDKLREAMGPKPLDGQ